MLNLLVHRVTRRLNRVVFRVVTLWLSGLRRIVLSLRLVEIRTVELPVAAVRKFVTIVVS
jgi:hypothetical protein